MKTKEYIEKYHLDKKRNFNYRIFLNDFGKEFGVLLQKYPKESFTEEQFETVIMDLKQKFDSISNKAVYGIPIKIWNYFYATTISNKRKKLFPLSDKNRNVKKYKKNYFKK